MRFLSFFLLLIAGPLAAEIVTITASPRSLSTSNPTKSSETITLEKGDLATVKYLNPAGNIDVTIGSKVIRLAPPSSNETPPMIAGPASIRLLNYNTLGAALTTVEITRRSDTPDLTPHQVVVIPNDGSGAHDVLLESSSDMVSWTATQPGLFNSSTAMRFFRVRISKR